MEDLMKITTVKPVHGSVSVLTGLSSGVHPRPDQLYFEKLNMNNVLTLPVPHPKLVEANARAQAKAQIRRDQELAVKGALAEGFQFVIIQPSADSQGMTICWRKTGFNLCEVSTTILNPRDKIIPVVGKYEALSRAIAGKSITLKKPANVSFQEYLSVIFTFASVR